MFFSDKQEKGHFDESDVQVRAMDVSFCTLHHAHVLLQPSGLSVSFKVHSRPCQIHLSLALCRKMPQLQTNSALGWQSTRAPSMLA